ALEVKALQGFVLAEEDVCDFGLGWRFGRGGINDHGDLGLGCAGQRAQRDHAKNAGNKRHGRSPQNTKSMPRLMISPSKSGMFWLSTSRAEGTNMPSKPFSVLTCLYSPLSVTFGIRL